MTARVLVTGGAGYIGSHTVKLLLERGWEVAVVDNLSRGHRHNVDPAHLRVLDIADTAGLARLMREHGTQAVIHFAALIAVGESMQEPERYFRNNLAGSLSLVEAMVEAGVRAMVFSSTAAVYGIPHASPILEEFPIQPVSPYGESKALVERLLAWFERLRDLRSISLRYFNAAGADPGGELGEEHDPETHLVPLALRAQATGRPMTIFGDDYPTPDGTCIRDYIHVNDLAEAHILAVNALLRGSPSRAYNVGTGTGHSVRAVLRAVEKATGCAVPHAIGPRRPGDPPVLVADAGKLRAELGWRPRFAQLTRIVETAWNFARRRR